jgi:Flp pilus assembly pilin Flp
VVLILRFFTRLLGVLQPSVLRRQDGQTTAEYALVILAAAAVAVVLIAWARSSGRLPAFFNTIVDSLMGDAGA